MASSQTPLVFASTSARSRHLPDASVASAGHTLEPAYGIALTSLHSLLFAKAAVLGCGYDFHPGYRERTLPTSPVIRANQLEYGVVVSF